MAIKSQTPLFKPKWEINKHTIRPKDNENKWSTKWAAIFQKKWPVSNQNQTKSIMNKHKVKHHRNPDFKKGNREPHQNHRPGTVSNKLQGA